MGSLLFNQRINVLIHSTIFVYLLKVSNKSQPGYEGGIEGRVCLQSAHLSVRVSLPAQYCNFYFKEVEKVSCCKPENEHPLYLFIKFVSEVCAWSGTYSLH